MLSTAKFLRSRAVLCTAVLALVSACGGGDDSSGNEQVSAVAENADRSVIQSAAEAKQPGTQTSSVLIEKAPAGEPFGRTLSVNLAAHGYVEEEFFISGTASRYRISNPLATAVKVDEGYPYKTKILVRRPAHASKFSGTVVVEWMNVSLGQDMDWTWAATHEDIVRKGHAWVGVSAQLVGVAGLKRSNADRYASLSLAAPNVDPVGGKPLDSTGDVLAYDVYAQLGAALKADDRHAGKREDTAHNGVAAVDPLPGMKVKVLLALGMSQSAFRMGWYYNSVHPLYSQVYDGFHALDCNFALRQDLNTKFMAVCSQPTRPFVSAWTTPDSDTFRLWEVAGASHLSLAMVVPFMDEQVRRDRAMLAPDGTALTFSGTNPPCANNPIYSRVETEHVATAALEALRRWVKNGEAPSLGGRFTTNAAGAVITDSEGRATGGVRLASLDAPRATNLGVNTGPGTCFLLGSHVDYTPAQLCAQYGTKQNYVAQVTLLTRRAERDGYVLAVDAHNTIREAQQLAFTCGG